MVWTSWCGAVLWSLCGGDGSHVESSWPAWRGPDQTGASADATPPSTWSEENNLRWKTSLPGRGTSTPIIWDDSIYLLSYESTDREATPDELAARPLNPDARTAPPTSFQRFLLLCLDRGTGDVLWETEVVEALPHEGHHKSHGLTGSSPTTDGTRLYVSFGSYGVFAFDMDGTEVWRRQFPPQWTRRAWGEAASPAVFEETLIVPWDHEGDSFVVALDAATGKTRWRAERPEPTTWATPLLVRHDDVPMAVLNGTQRVRAYHLETGEVLWERGGQTVNAIPCPLRHGDHVIAMSGYRGQLAVSIPLGARGDLADESVRWEYRTGTPYVPSPALFGDRLWFTQGNQALLTELDAATGEMVVDRMRLEGLGDLYASPLAVAGRLYLCDRDGNTLVLDTQDDLQPIALNSLDCRLDASPVALGDQLFLRGHHEMYCIKSTE